MRISAIRNNLSAFFNDNELLLSLRQWFGFNRWAVSAYLILIALATIFYISNVIAVNNLMEDIQIANAEYEKLYYQNKILSGRIIGLQSANRIIPIAKSKLGLSGPTQPPEIIE